jgi:hypothetical protein
MSQDKVIQEVGEVLAKEIRSDCVGLWTILWEVRQRLPSLSAAEARSTVMIIVRAAIERGLVVPGDFVEARFVPWEASASEALARIDEAWLALGREPNIGDVVWFVAPTLPS